MLLEPMLDCACVSASMDDPRCSLTWSSASNRYAWGAALGDMDADHPLFGYVVPAWGRTAGLPRTYVDVGTFDIFRDEVSEFADRLKASGVGVEFHTWSQGFHGFQTLAPETHLALEAARVRRSALARLLGKGFDQSDGEV
jgi:acetyl esterase/lipase